MMRLTRMGLLMPLLMLFIGIPALAQTKTTVIVTITGLVSFLDTTAGGSPPPKRFYLMNASHTASVHHMVPHIAVILAHDDYNATVLDARTLHSVGTGNTLHHWVELTGAEEVTVKGGSATALKYNETAPTTLCPEDPESSLYFLPRLSRVSKKKDGRPIDRNDLDPVYLKPKKANGRMAAFMDVTFGKLEARIKSPVVWAFKDSPNSIGATHQQMIAPEVTWTFEIAGDTLVLQTATDGGAPKDFLELTADGDKEILFTIANAPNEPEELGVKLLAGVEKMTAYPPYDHHFALYYEHLKKNVKHDGAEAYVRYIPVAAGVCRLDAATNLHVFDPNPCELRKFVDIPDPGNCPPIVVVAVDGVNCGPDNLP